MFIGCESRLLSRRGSLRSYYNEHSSPSNTLPVRLHHHHHQQQYQQPHQLLSSSTVSLSSTNSAAHKQSLTTWVYYTVFFTYLYFSAALYCSLVMSGSKIIAGSGGSDVRVEGSHIRGEDLKLEVGEPRSPGIPPNLIPSLSISAWRR